MIKSLRTKMTLLVLVLSLPFLIASIQGLLFATEQSNLQERKSFIKRTINRLVQDLRGPDPRSRIAELYDRSGLEAMDSGAALVDRNGTVLWESKHRSPMGERRRAQERILDDGILLYLMPEREDSNGVDQLAYAIIGIGLISYGAGAWFLVGATLKPISRLVTRVKGAQNEPNPIISPPSTDREVVDLVDTLNRLIHDVRAESDERIKSYATLSHELRTPIHSLLLKLDLALGNEQTKEELEATLLEVQRQVYRLKNLSETVLTLQGLSQSLIHSTPEPLEIQPLIDEIMVDLQPVLDLKSTTIKIQLSDPLTILARREHLVLLLRNLLENAIKHSPFGSVVTVTGSGSELCIVNPAKGNSQLAGNGLGLRICREVARANKWILSAAEDQGQFRATVLFQ